jgi:rod shape-determining protein MreD
MSVRRRFGRTLELLAILALGCAAIYLSLLPLGSDARLPTPDLVFCLVLAWVARRPAEAPLWAILTLGLAADLFLSRPLGLGALGLLLAAEAMRASAASLSNGPFLAEWASAAVLALAVMLGAQVALEITFIAGPGLAALLRAAASTALAYPLVAALLAFGVGMRGARRPRDGDRLGRIA